MYATTSQLAFQWQFAILTSSRRAGAVTQGGYSGLSVSSTQRFFARPSGAASGGGRIGVLPVKPLT
jgi:hypothetical protein